VEKNFEEFFGFALKNKAFCAHEGFLAQRVAQNTRDFCSKLPFEKRIIRSPFNF